MKKTRKLADLAKDAIFQYYLDDDIRQLAEMSRRTRDGLQGKMDQYIDLVPDQVLFAAYPLVKLTKAGEDFFSKKINSLIPWSELTGSKLFLVSGQQFIDYMKSCDQVFATRVMIAIGLIKISIKAEVAKNKLLLKKSMEEENE